MEHRPAVLIVEDIEEFSELIALYLRKSGMEPFVAPSAEAGLVALARQPFDAVVLDINLPMMDGFQFLEAMRVDYTLPVLITSARGSEEDMIRGLRTGADEYITKPFSPRVLAERIKALLRRDRLSARGAPSETHIQFGGYSLYTDSCILTRGGERIPLTNREFDVLLLLALEAGRIFTVEEIYKKIWNNEYGDMTTVAVHIQRIRKKIEEDPGNPQILLTRHGRGYFLAGRDGRL